MSKWITSVVGAAEIALGVVLIATGVGAALGTYLVVGGIGTTITGLGTLLSKGSLGGIATTVRNPTAPWHVVYGRARVGGTVVYMHFWPDQNKPAFHFPVSGGDKMLDLVIVLAAHKCQSIDALLFDQQRVQIDTSRAAPGADPSSGTSFTPVQQHVNITEIKRSNGVVTVTLTRNIPFLTVGDQIKIAEDGPGSLTANALIGTFQVAQILVQMTGSLIFTYQSGGINCDILGHGHVDTLWADYGHKVYFEPMLGGQTLGQTFAGMSGTPFDGDMGNFVNPDNVGGLGDSGDVTAANPWTSFCSLQGKTAVFLRLHYNDKYFRAGLPQISFLIHGKNDIFDPRTSTHGYTENAALCIADLLANTSWGFKAAYGTEIPNANLISAANTCDAPVPLASSQTSPPTTEPAYTCNGQFDLTMKRGEILQNMLTSCAGRITYVGGQFVIWPGAWTGTTFSIGTNPGGGIIPLGNYNSIAAGPIRWKPTVSIRDLYNAVKGTYISPYNKWMPSDFPPYAQDALHGYGSDANLAADGGDRRYLDIQLPFTVSASMAQRIAKIELLRRRHFGTGTFTFNLTAYQVTPLDIMEVTNSYLGWSNKLLEVVRSQFRAEEGGESTSSGAGGSGKNSAPRLLVELEVQETDSSIYAWSTTEELAPQGYVQPVIPGVGTFGFFSQELVPGYTVPFPWSPAFIGPLVGDALYPTPVYGSPRVNHGFSRFGLRINYTLDAHGNPVANLILKGALPPNRLSQKVSSPPQITCVRGTSGSLPPGSYLVTAAALSTDTVPADSALCVPVPITIPAGPSNGSIAVTVTWPDNSNGGAIYMSISSDKTGYHRQTVLTSVQTTFTITNFDRLGIGAPDTTFDHLAVSWKKEIHGGPWAQQVQAVTSNTITIAQNVGDAPMTTNQWAGRVLSLLGKLDSTQDVIVLNMPVSASSASFNTSPGPPNPLFTLTIGPNSNGDQLPDLTTLLSIGDLVLMRFKGTFTTNAMFDPLTANPYYPNGATGVEAGHLAMVLTGPDAGDVQTISSMVMDSFGNFTTMLLAGTWKIQPNTGDIVIVVAADWAPEVHTHSYAISSNNAYISAVVAEPPVQSIIDQAWVFVARTQTVGDVNGDDAFAPICEIYSYGSQTRNFSGTTTHQLTDQVVNALTASGPAVYNCLQQSAALNHRVIIQKMGSDTNTVKINAFAGDYFDALGTTTITLANDGDKAELKFGG